MIRFLKFISGWLGIMLLFLAAWGFIIIIHDALGRDPIAQWILFTIAAIISGSVAIELTLKKDEK